MCVYEYYSAMRKKEMLPFATIWVDLKGIMQSEITQTKTKTAWYHIYEESKKKKVKLLEIKIVKVVVRGWGQGGEWWRIGRV